MIDDIRRCWKLDNGLKHKWQSALLNIDLFHPDATNEIRRLRHQVEGYCNDLPPDYGYWDTSTYLLRDGLELTAFDMKRLEEICSGYQKKG
ncbi:MAG: hypothetical protein KAJ09_02980 [Deltaproteobacteria bacterium]|nr:hypothetical protein [Deltaproteobacteria bacterium]